eukprot:TRINITY_DN30232_c0_g1_i1.p1 TRINITY_DN30232_c0_g1~~TRINITY_DN30232_c0_g1_i1.p1  ORF type:complete len:539 (+),score=142.52 TRINITY_DN30232_c0_g1_i1:79-1695(+)
MAADTGITEGEGASKAKVDGKKPVPLPANLDPEILKRFEEVTTAEYPFERPEREKVPPQQRLRLTSMRTLSPVVMSLLKMVVVQAAPVVLMLLAARVVLNICSGRGAFESYTSAMAFFVAASGLKDGFFLHRITGGSYGSVGGSSAKQGFFCKDTEQNKRLMERLRPLLDAYTPVPYFWTGDLLTGMPFMLFKGSVGGRVQYVRRWIRVASAPAPDGPDGPKRVASGKDDDEACALDIKFPDSGYNPDKPVFLILHGLNGGSTETYVLDLVRKATKEGCTCAVLIARGLMKTPVRGEDIFHGARTSDVGAAVDALLYALDGEKRKPAGDGAPKARITLVGFSMGAIIAANYAAKAKDFSGLAGCVAFSGAICGSQTLDSEQGKRGMGLWQPVLAWALKGTIVVHNMAKMVKKGITVAAVEKISSVCEMDTKLVCKYHGYETVRDYYEDMSAGGRGDEAGKAKLAGAKTPLLSVHALDDPITPYQCCLAKAMPETEHCILMATTHGGHIGWPTGMSPSKRRFGFMVDVAMEFASAVAAA